MRSFLGFASGIALALSVSTCGLVLPVVASTQTLFGQVEVLNTPRIEEFEDLVRSDFTLPCWVKQSMPRLVRVAHDPRLRVIVWHRMCRQELYEASSKTLTHIEHLADICNMPLRSSKN